jgi:hypothetical protein
LCHRRSLRDRADRIRARVYELGTWDSNLSLLFPLLAWGALIHKTQLPEPFTSPGPPLVVLAALAVLWLPRSVVMAELLSVALFLEVVSIQPSTVNHTVYLVFMSGGVIVTAVRGRVLASRLTPSPSTVEAELPALLRGGVYLLFGFAVLHKLNHGFMDPTGSCAVGQYTSLQARLPFLPPPGNPTFAATLIGTTLAAETAIPVLLWRPSTRLAGLVVAFAFHLVMGVNGHHAFSALSPALYVPFLGQSTHRQVSRALAPDSGRTLVRRTWQALVVTSTALGFIVFLAGVTGKLYLAFELGYAYFVLSYPAVFVLFLAMGDRHRSVEPFPSPRGGLKPSAVAVTMWALLALNGMSPYLGLKTESSFSMFSNLRTEGGDWNHLFVPSPVQIFPLQDSLVHFAEVRPSGGPLSRLAERRAGVVPMHARRLVIEACRTTTSPIDVLISVDGVSTSVPDLCESPWAEDGGSWLGRHLLVFRPIPSENVCTH